MVFRLEATSIARWLLAAIMVLGTCTGSFAMEEKLKHFTLPNGLEVLVKEDHARKAVAIQYWVLVGSADEESSERGISHLIEHMAFKGTERRGVGKIASEVEALGGETNAYTSWDETVFFITVPPQAVIQGLDILTDAVFRPAINAQELEREKEVVLEEILEGDERPERKASKQLLWTSYARSPYRFPVIGYKETVENFNRDNILTFRKKWYVPENMFLLIVGDVNADAIRSDIARITADVKPRGFFRIPRAGEPPQKEIRSVLERDRNARETRLNLAFHIPSMRGNDVNALDLAADVLGARESSRLVRVLKKEKELVHSISASALTPKESGLMLVSATLDAKNLEAATRTIVDEVGRLAKEGPSPSELERAKVHIESQHLYARETVQGMARSIGNFKADAGDPMYEEKYLALNAAVTSDQVSKVVDTYMRAPNATISVLMPENAPEGISAEKLTAIISSSGKTAVAGRNEVLSKSEATMHTLPNGVQVVLVPDESNPVVSVKMAFLGGKRFENKENEGIINFISQMLDKGSKGMSEVEIARKVEDMGGRLSGFSGYDSFGLSATFFSRYLNEGLSLLAELYKGPSFPADTLERERALILNRIKTEPDRPVQYAVNVLGATLFNGHPYGFVKEGNVTTVSGFTAEDLKQTYERFAVPSNMVISVVGDINAKTALDKINEIFGNIPARPLEAPSISPERPLKDIREKIVRIPRAKTHLAIGFLGTKIADQDRCALDVLNNVLAGQGGRLFLQLRDKESLAYTVTSFVRPGLDRGLFAFYMACDPPKADRAFAGLLGQINLVREKAVSDEELKRAINNLIGEHLISLQSTWSRAENTALNTLYGLGYDYDPKYLQKIAAVTADDVLKVARKYLDPKHCAIAKIVPEENES